MGSVKIHADITIVQWNARSISGYKMQHKKGQLINFLKTFKNTPQVVCLQETWNKSTKNPVTLKGYKNAATYKRKNNEKGRGRQFMFRKVWTSKKSNTGSKTKI